MKRLKIAIHPGWGFSKDAWKSWKDKFSHPIQFVDRGYFNAQKDDQKFLLQNHRIAFNPEDFNVLITHSLGLHLIDEEMIKNTSLLIIIGGFVHFGTDFKTKIALKLMKDKLKKEPKEVLKLFYERCDYPDAYAMTIPDSIDIDRLLADLCLLDSSKLDLSIFQTIFHISIFHGKEDKIV